MARIPDDRTPFPLFWVSFAFVLLSPLILVWLFRADVKAYVAAKMGKPSVVVMSEEADTAAARSV